MHTSGKKDGSTSGFTSLKIFEFKKDYPNVSSAFTCTIIIIWATELPMDSSIIKIFLLDTV